jgi:hypothetical protein
MAKSKLGISANVFVEVFDESGKQKLLVERHNTITTAGLYGIADQLLASPLLAKAGWCEVGTGTGGSVKLGTYLPGSRTAFTSKTRVDNVVTMVTDFAVGIATGSISEAGIFNVVTEDTEDMWCYVEFDPVVVIGTNDSLRITWTITGT